MTHYCRVRLQLIFVQFFTVIDLQQMFSYLHFYMNGMVLDWGPCEQLWDGECVQEGALGRYTC